MLTGKVLDVSTHPAGSLVAEEYNPSLPDTLAVYEVYDFSPDGGTLRIGEQTFDYLTVDYDLSTITISPDQNFGGQQIDTQVLVEPYAETKMALVDLNDEGDGLPVTVTHSLSALLSDGQRDPDNMETITIEETSPGLWVAVDILDQKPQLTTPVLDISLTDGLPPTGSPTPTVIGGLGVIHARWPGLENADPVTYDVHISDDPGFAPVTQEAVVPGDPTVDDPFDTLTEWDTPVDLAPITNLQKRPNPSSGGTSDWYILEANGSAIEDASTETYQATGGPGPVAPWKRAERIGTPVVEADSHEYKLMASGLSTYKYADVVPGVNYTFSIWFKSSVTGPVGIYGNYYTDSTGTGASTFSSGVSAFNYTVAETWQRFEYTATAPALKTAAEFSLRLDEDLFVQTTGDYIGWAMATVLPTTVAATIDLDTDFINGAVTDTSEFDYAWTGTANSSTSTRTPVMPVNGIDLHDGAVTLSLIPPAVENLLWDSIPIGGSDWAFSATAGEYGDGFNTGTGAGYGDPGPTLSGTQVDNWFHTEFYPGNPNVWEWVGTPSETHWNDIAVQPDTDYTASIWFRHHTAPAPGEDPVYGSVGFFDSEGSLIGGFQYSPDEYQGDADTWYRAQVTATSPSNAAYARVYGWVQIGDMPLTSTCVVDFTAYSLHETSSMRDLDLDTELVYGDFPATATHLLQWSGAANSSSSLRKILAPFEDVQLERINPFDLTNAVATYTVNFAGMAGDEAHASVTFGTTGNTIQLDAYGDRLVGVYNEISNEMADLNAASISAIRVWHDQVYSALVLEVSPDGLSWTEAVRGPSASFNLAVMDTSVWLVPGETDISHDSTNSVTHFTVAPLTVQTTLAVSTESTSVTIKSLPDGSPLQYGVTYYVKLIARDADGSADPGGEGSAAPVQVTTPDVAANFIYGNTIVANQLIGGEIQSDLILSGNIKTATSGARVALGPFGLTVYDSAGVPTTLLGSNGVSTFRGQAEISNLTVTGGMAIRGTSNELAKGATLLLGAAISASPNSPTVVVDYETSNTWAAVAGMVTPTYRSIQKLTSDWLLALRSGTSYRACQFNADGTLDRVHGGTYGDGLDLVNAVQINNTGPVYAMGTNGRIYRLPYTDSVAGATRDLFWDFAAGNPGGITTSGTVAFTGGYASLTANAGSDAEFRTTTAMNLRGKQVSAKVTPPIAVLAGGQKIEMRLEYDSTVWATAYVERALSGSTPINRLYFTTNSSSGSGVDYTTSMAYWRIAESNGSFQLYTSSDGITYTLRLTRGHSFSTAQLASTDVVFREENGGTELISNTSFETSFTGWTKFLNEAWTDYPRFDYQRVTDQAYDGTYSARVYANQNAFGGDLVGLRFSDTSLIPQVAGSSYQVSFKARASASGRVAKNGWARFDANKNYLGFTWGGAGYTGITIPTASWGTLTDTYTSSDSTGYFTPVLLVGPTANVTSGTTIAYLDDTSLIVTGSATALVTRIDDVAVEWGPSDFGTTFTRKDASNAPALGTDGTDLLVSEYDTVNNKVVIYKVDPRSPGVITSTLTSGTHADFAATRPLIRVDYGSFDLGASRYLVYGSNGSPIAMAFSVSGSTLTYQPTQNFPLAGLAGGAYDGTQFWSLNTDGVMSKHTGIVWTDSSAWTKTWFGASSWYDGNATGGTHETTASPRASFSMKKRARYTVTSTAIPDEGGTDDPDRIRVYLASGLATTLYLQGTSADGVNSLVLTSATFSGTSAPVSSNFPNAIPGQIKNDSSSLLISGLGTIKGTTVEATTHVTTPLYKGYEGGAASVLADPYLSLMMDWEVVATGGGILVGNGTGVSWSQRIMLMGAGRHATYVPAGYFQIDMPANGTVITRYNAVAGVSDTVTVASGVIPLSTWSTLYYVVPFGATSTSLPANFRIVNYTAGNDFTTPWNWIPIVTRNGGTSGDSEAATFGTHRWIGGRYTTVNPKINNTFPLGTQHDVDTAAAADVGLSVTVAVSGPSDVYQVTICMDIQRSSVQTNVSPDPLIFVGRLVVDGVTQTAQIICRQPIVSLRGTYSQVYTVTGLAAGNRDFKLQRSISGTTVTGGGDGNGTGTSWNGTSGKLLYQYRINSIHTNIQITQQI